MSPRGAPLTQARVADLAAGPGVVIVCARFEGVDERLIEARGLEEVSLGDFVLSGGEIAALALLDACVRLLPGVMGKEASAAEESFADGLLEYPQYTRPPVFEGEPIPEVLLSGDHAKVAAWRRAEAERLTRERRPDLWAAYLARKSPKTGLKAEGDKPRSFVVEARQPIQTRQAPRAGCWRCRRRFRHEHHPDSSKKSRSRNCRPARKFRISGRATPCWSTSRWSKATRAASRPMRACASAVPARGLNENFTVRKISYGEGVERVFPLYAPMINSITVVRRGKVRRAKLYYLRGLRGKKARIEAQATNAPEAAETAATTTAKTTAKPAAKKLPRPPPRNSAAGHSGMHEGAAVRPLFC